MAGTAVRASLSLTIEPNGTAVLTFDAPEAPVNTFSLAHLQEFDRQLDTLEQTTGITGLIFHSGKPGNFIAGADLHEILQAGAKSGPEKRELIDRGQRVFTRISRLAFPTVAAIDGMCVGGGLECVLAFDFRIVSNNPRTEIGAPEVKIGLIPGWGGTQRLPRLIGIDRAIEMNCVGNSISGVEAVDLDLAWELTPVDRLMDEARRCLEMARADNTWKAERELRERPMGLSPDNIAFNTAVGQSFIAAQTKGQYPAPLAALTAMLEGCNLPLKEGLAKEVEQFLPLLGSEINRNLVRHFFIDQRVRKDTGVADRQIAGRSIGLAGVIGAGQMGAGIAFAHARRGFDVFINDVSDQAVQAGLARLKRPMEGRIKAGRMTSAEMVDALAHVRMSTEKSDLRKCDLVVEAVVEKHDVKCALLKEIESLVSRDTIIASNTSTISITGMGKTLQHPDRFIGMHFFNPVDRMALVEVIRGRDTSDATTATVVAHAKALGKKPVVVQDCPGFVVNRCLLPYLNEALLMVEEGIEMERIDRAGLEFGMPMGPITLMDLVGLDVTLLAGNVLAEAFSDRCVTSELLPRLIEKGRLGQKSGAGFFAYDPRKPGRGRNDKVVAGMVRELGRPGRPADAQDIQDRLFLTMLTEAVRIVEERVVRTPEDVDFAMVQGTGFPAFRGGILRWADVTGARAIADKLDRWKELGRRFECPALLLEMTRSDRKFFAD